MIGWFDRLARPLDESDRRAARDYLDAFGYDAGIETRLIIDPAQAEAVIRAPDWDARWWTRELDARDSLRHQLEIQIGSVALMEKLSSQTLAPGDEAYQAACRALGSEVPLARAAAGAAAMAQHDHTLANLAGTPGSHVFMRKYRLFALGRWPLGVIHDIFHLY